MAIKYNVGDVFDTPNGKVKILSMTKGFESKSQGIRIRAKSVIQFLETGTVREVRTEYLHRDYIADYNKPTVYGVGYIGSELRIPPRGIINRIYNLWRQMLYRVHGNNKIMKKYYADVTIEKCWYNFTKFLNTIWEVDGYEQWEKNEGVYVLDKDTKIAGNKLYSRKTCQFITNSDNIRDGAMRRWHGSSEVMTNNPD